MKKHKAPQVPLPLFGQAEEPFALVQESTQDGQRLAAEQARKEADQQHAGTLQGVLIVARDDDGREVSRQIVPDETAAIRAMISRNRPPPNPTKRGPAQSFPKWGIETETTQPGIKGTFHVYGN